MFFQFENSNDIHRLTADFLVLGGGRTGRECSK